MRGVRPLVALVPLLVLSGCNSCGSKTTPTEGGASSASASATAASTATPPELSLPIGGDVAPDGSVYVAGFVAARKAIVLARYDAAGALVSVGDAFTAAEWASGTELRVFSGTRGAAVAFRGVVATKQGQHVRLMDPAAKPVGDAFDVDGIPCATKDGVVGLGGGHVVTHPFDGAAPKIGPAAEADDALACGDARAYVLDEGDDGLVVRPIDKDVKTNVAHGDGDDEPREHPAFTVGDELSVFVVTTGGALKIASPFDAPVKDVGKLHDDEDLVAVDGDAKRALVVYTKDDTTRCGADGLVSDVHLSEIPRDGSKPVSSDVVKGGCDVDLGPFWIGAAAGKTVIAWGERDGKRSKGAPPVTGLGYRVLGEAAPQKVALSGEDVTFAGCSATKCWAVSLERPTGTDGMVPGKARLIPFP